MNKVFGVALVGALVVGGVVLIKGASGASSAITPEGKMCVRLGELCGADPSTEKLESCVEDMKKMRKMSGDAAFERSQSCVAESKSCGAASGCMMGGVGVGTLGEVLKGFGTALSK